MAHTPGPWRLHPHSGTIIVNGSTVYSVKDLTTENEAGLAGEASMDDKRLMAAAPELLVSLRDLLQQIRLITFSDSIGRRALAEAMDTGAADAAIAKAEGRE